MPELPEVETIRRSLAVKLPNRTVTDILIRDSRLREPVNEERLNQLICGRKVFRAAPSICSSISMVAVA